jgi:AAA15 family ATPase/GTPase
VPLSSIGDGLTRLFHIGLAMANASDGILLIDEFENGLHWEVQQELWTALFKVSRDFGIQVFATTHSTDCIRGFIAAQSEMLELNKNFVYRLERRGENAIAVELPTLNLDAALQHKVEVR